MPFTAAEKAQLKSEHPDSICLAVVKDRLQKVMLLQKEHRHRTISIVGREWEIEMLHGATYFIGGDPDIDPARCVTADRIVSGNYFCTKRRG